MTHRWFEGLRKEFKRPKSIVVVSGLGRSYTSLMMKLLRDAGYDIYYDIMNKSDSYPDGKFEHSDVKSLHRPNSNLSWMGDLNNKVVKIVFPYIKNIDLRHNYKIIVMQRPIHKIRQRVMDNYGEYKSISLDVLKRRWNEGISFLDENDINYIIVRHNEIINNDIPDRVLQFLEE